jgi:peptidoglycan/LPS O-acetylase OafA/YrhL
MPAFSPEETDVLPQEKTQAEAARQAQVSTHPKYRPDIDGLRAVAVLSVLVFHGFPNILKGGFIGVDIFFVISGFLISTIIINGLRQNVFSFVEFYARRVKRIFPALLVVLLSCLVAGWFTLYDGEYQQLGKHVLGGAGFVANLVLLAESNYFDVMADSKPLLHLWSLGIEEQFYFFWPLALWVAARRRWNLPLVTLGVIALSFVWNLAWVHSDPTVTFYAPQTRFWELLVGSLLAYAMLGRQSYAAVLYPDTRSRAHRAVANACALAGVVMLAAGLLLLNKYRAFPGWWAWLPVGGAAALIAAGPQALFNRWILGNPVLRWFGVISFPLYLWHWPLLAFARILEGQTPGRLTRAGLLLLSVLLAWLTYKLIESPLRFGRERRHKTAALLGGVALAGAFGLGTFLSNGFAGARPGLAGAGAQEFAAYFENTVPGFHYYDLVGLHEKYRDECNFYDLLSLRKGIETRAPLEAIAPACYTRDPAKPKAVFVWGDSLAQQLYHGLQVNLPPEWQILQVGTSGCEPRVNVLAPTHENYCLRSNWFALKTLAETKPDVVVVSFLAQHTVPNMNLIADKLKALGVGKVIFVGSSPQWTANLPGLVARKLWPDVPRRTLVGVDQQVLQDDARLRQNFRYGPGVTFVSMIDLLCKQDGCTTYVGDNLRDGLIGYDQHHLTPAGSDYVAKHLLVESITGVKP